MVLPTLPLSKELLLQPEPLTPAVFAPFGTVIAPPFASSLSQYPRTILPSTHDWNDRRQPLPIPPPLFPDQQVQAVDANQSTALKTSPVSPLLNNYPSAAPSHGSHKPSQGQMSIFSCFPRENVYTVGSGNNLKYRLKLGILERHPYTTQTFCPFNYSSPATESKSKAKEDTYMVVVVAPTISDATASPPNPPDLSKVRCFFARLQEPEYMKVAVTYNAGTWHAPMIVLGARRVDFLVTQFANGVPEDDCQEVHVGSGPDEPCPTSHELYLRWREGGLTNAAELDVTFMRKDMALETKTDSTSTSDGAANDIADETRHSKL